MRKEKKFFNKNINSIISIVALVECIVIIAFATFSWIESASSLIIRGDYLTISSGRNYVYEISDTKKLVDLSTYFINSEHFSFAQASSVDGNNFYFPYTTNGTTKAYRKGDTTDFNVTYYNFDFEAYNPSASYTYDYYFESEDIFSLPDKVTYVDAEGKTKTVDDDQKVDFLNAFRIAVSTNGATTIYSKNGATINAVNSISGASDSQISEAYNGRVYPKSGETKTPVFSVGSSERENVNVKIWFEEKDTTLTDALVKNALLGATIDIDLRLVSEESDFDKLQFQDYSLFTSDESSYDTVYYVYTEQGKEPVYYPMTRVNSTRNCTTWETSDDSNSPIEAIPSGLTLNNGYFTYGHYDKGEFVDLCKWDLSSNTDSTLIYYALSATKTDSSIKGYGYWNTTDITRVSFVDRTTSASVKAFNADSQQFISEDRIYVVNDNVPIKLNYFAVDDRYEAYVPTEWLYNGDSTVDSLSFIYTSNDYYSTTSDNRALIWQAPEQQDSTTYTALGYSQEALLNNLKSSESGIGTWGAVEEIHLSAELIDSTVVKNPANYFRVGFDNNFIYMSSKSNNPFYYTAYVPVDSYLAFNYGELGSTNKVGITAGEIGNSCSTYYLTNIIDGQQNGYWNLAVLVDGTSDNLVNYTLTNANSDIDTTGATLNYTINNTDKQMHQIDDYRWVTDDLTGVTSVSFTWKAYAANESLGYIDTVFDYELDTASDGIHYLTVTENGTIILSDNDN